MPQRAVSTIGCVGLPLSVAPSRSENAARVQTRRSQGLPPGAPVADHAGRHVEQYIGLAVEHNPFVDRRTRAIQRAEKPLDHATRLRVG